MSVPATAPPRAAAPKRPTPQRQSTSSRSRWRNRGWVLFFLLPSAVPLVVFTLAPMVNSLWVSLHDWNLVSPMTWVGLDNYADLLTSSDTWRVLGNTLFYILGYLPLVYVGGLGLAMLLNRALKGRTFFRAAYFLPVITSWVVVALVWQWLLNPSNGLVNQLIQPVLDGLNGLFGTDMTAPGWWTDPQWAMPSVILASAWKDLGFVMVILLAGLQAIPGDVLEAARVDGAGAWKRFWHITFPLLSPSTFFVLVISLINGFQVFDQVYVMTGGGPSGASQVVVGQIYDLTFRYGRAGDASALSWILFVLILIVTALQMRGQRRWVNHA
ncbi:sugar ABC transporter permease [Oerskovia turbata]|uniref:Sugar ABC transporter permease n=1 Tax=Oerskovia turbata TaxID=1713 RepID=A0A4Q1KLX9_9CELL|nr:sugar ABC transporter permease [Oerskovia turbata]RXR22756.1 sugar ABC transporter permease [Oerskovia turbata]RXR30702.1 sugar ABC transporter permease [Oerskovia turbata]TGJ96021.1 sugar ABC transporter permease [Actinotalea fermentans ATCC 43279 = JCM 9966 = DSM 3133]